MTPAAAAAARLANRPMIHMAQSARELAAPNALRTRVHAAGPTRSARASQDTSTASTTATITFHPRQFTALPIISSVRSAALPLLLMRWYSATRAARADASARPPPAEQEPIANQIRTALQNSYSRVIDLFRQMDDDHSGTRHQQQRSSSSATIPLSHPPSLPPSCRYDYCV